jgi:hypothetical protein
VTLISPIYARRDERERGGASICATRMTWRPRFEMSRRVSVPRSRR